MKLYVWCSETMAWCAFAPSIEEARRKIVARWPLLNDLGDFLSEPPSSVVDVPSVNDAPTFGFSLRGEEKE